MVLYYVGLILPRVDPRLIQVADELNFVLICMPENEPNLRYSELIHEAMDAIVRDELNHPTFTVDLLDQMTKVPASQQSVRTILRITSDRLRASAVITDSEYQVLSEASWPRNQNISWAEIIRRTDRHGGDRFWEIRGRPDPLGVSGGNSPQQLRPDVSVCVFRAREARSNPLEAGGRGSARQHGRLGKSARSDGFVGAHAGYHSG